MMYANDPNRRCISGFVLNCIVAIHTQYNPLLCSTAVWLVRQLFFIASVLPRRWVLTNWYIQGSNCEKWTGRVSNTVGTKGLAVGGHNGMNRGTGGLNPQPPLIRILVISESSPMNRNSVRLLRMRYGAEREKNTELGVVGGVGCVVGMTGRGVLLWHSNSYYNLPYNPSAPFVRSGFLVSYRIRSAMKIPQNVLHYIWHTSRVYVIHKKSLSRYFQLTQNWTDKAKWRSIDASKNVNKHTGHGLLAVNWLAPPRINFTLVKFNSTDGSTWQFIHSAAVPMALFQTRRVPLASEDNSWVG